MDKGRGGKTTSGNGQAWSSASARGQWRTGKNGKKLVVKSSVVPKRPSRLMMMTYTVERTNATEIRPDEQNEKAESCRENVWNEIHLKGP